MPAPDLSAKFGARKSVNGRVVSAHTNNVTLLIAVSCGYDT